MLAADMRSDLLMLFLSVEVGLCCAATEAVHLLDQILRRVLLPVQQSPHVYEQLLSGFPHICVEL